MYTYIYDIALCGNSANEKDTEKKRICNLVWLCLYLCDGDVPRRDKNEEISPFFLGHYRFSSRCSWNLQL
jgi:hypothetical protein